MDKHRSSSSRVNEKLPRSAFGYFGSKQRLAKKILEYIPPHNCWVELFGGSLAMTMTKEPAMIEIVNDLDGEIVNVFRQMRDSGKELTHLLKLTPYAREEFKYAQKIDENDGDLERARKFLVRAMMSVNGVIAGQPGGFSVSDTYSRGGHEARVNRWHNYPARLEAVIDRLREVRIENKDGIELLGEFSNKPFTLVYMDPPYLGKRTSGYKVEAVDQEFHERLLNQALLCDCMIIISGYESYTYTRMLEADGNWRKIELDAATQTTNGNRLGREEVLWLNKPAHETLDRGEILVMLTEKEKRDTKVNPTRGKQKIYS